MGSDKKIKQLNVCQSCDSEKSYLTRRCGACGHQYKPTEMLEIVAGLLEKGSSMRSLRRQISEAGKGIGGDMLRAAAKLFSRNRESMGVVALMAVRDFGDPRIIPDEKLKARYAFGSQALRVEIAQTLLAAQTEEAQTIIEELKKLETDNQVKKAFDEPLTSSEGLSLALRSNLVDGKSMDGGDSEEPEEEEDEKEGKEKARKGDGADEDGGEKVIPYSEDLVEESQELAVAKPGPREGGQDEQIAAEEDKGDGETETEEEGEEEESEKEEPETDPGEKEEAQEAEEGDDEEDLQETSGVRHSVPPPLPVAKNLEQLASMESGAYQALVADKKANEKDYSRLILAAIVIVLLGAVIGYGVIKWNEKSGGEDAQVAEGTQPDKSGKAAADGKAGKDAARSPDEKNPKDEVEEEKAGEPVSHILSAEVSASSYHRKYPPEHVADGDPATVWQEEKSRKPEGEWLRFDFDHEVTFTKLGIASGFDFIDESGKDYYPLNCRLKDAELIFSNGETIKVNLEDKRSIQFVEANPPIKTMWVRLTVYSTYRGSWFNDNSIGEIEAWGYEGEEGEEEASTEEEGAREEKEEEEEDKAGEEEEESGGDDEGGGVEKGVKDEKKEGESEAETGGDEAEDKDSSE